MATLPDFIDQVSAAVAATSPGLRTRMSQDYGQDTAEFVGLGETRYQVRATLLNIISEDSGDPKTAVQVEVFVHHSLSRITDEQAYTRGQMATDQAAMLARGFFESLPSVFGYVDDGLPVVNETPERFGKRITYSIAAQVALTP